MPDSGMRFGKTLLFGVGLYAMRALLRRARNKKAAAPRASADFADTQPMTRWLRSEEEQRSGATDPTR